MDLYYNVLEKAAATNEDWLKVRNCAFKQNDNAVLMMLYANGFGVLKNFDIAMNYSCKIGISIGSQPSDLSSRLNHLAMLKKGRIERFDICSDIESKGMATFCSEMSDSRRDKGRNIRIANITMKWESSQKASFAKLREVLNEFAKRHGYEEINQYGRDGPSRVWEYQDQATVIEPFLTDIEEFEKGNLPQLSGKEFVELDNKLNQIYRQIMSVKTEGPDSPLGDTTISKEGIKHTQRAWLKYRDALVVFGSVKYPSVNPAAWKAFLTERRIEQLSELLIFAEQK